MIDFRWLKSLYKGETGGLLGNKVYSPATADVAATPRTIFTIAGGLVLITSITGVRTVIQAGGASTHGLSHSVGPTVIDAGTGADTGDAVGTIYSWTGDVTDPLQVGAAGIIITDGKIVATSVKYGGKGLWAPAGNIIYTHTVGTGSTRWILTYFPVDRGATVTGV